MTNLSELLHARAQGTMLETIGYRVLELDAEHALCEMAFRLDLSQLTGVFHTGALLTLADSTATALCMCAVDPSGSLDPAAFPLAIQVSANLIRNVSAGKAIGEARFVHKGRLTMVVETTVRDDRGKSLAVVTTTHIVPAAARSAS